MRTFQQQDDRRARDRRRPAYSDRPLNWQSDPPLGAHLVTPRRGYTHHGIYVGEGRVVQYGGLCRGLRSGPVEEVSQSEFARGRAIWIRLEPGAGLDPAEVIRRARLRLGEDRYRVLTNNCEHFCEWCIRGEHRSYQVDEFNRRCISIWQRLVSTLRLHLRPWAGAPELAPVAVAQGSTARCSR